MNLTHTKDFAKAILLASGVSIVLSLPVFAFTVALVSPAHVLYDAAGFNAQEEEFLINRPSVPGEEEVAFLCLGATRSNYVETKDNYTCAAVL